MVTDCTTQAGRQYGQVATAAAVVVWMAAIGTAPTSSQTVDPRNPQLDRAPRVVSDYAAYGTAGGSSGGSGGVSRGTVVNNTMEPLKQNTARNYTILVVLASDGKTGATGLAAGFTIRMSKNGAGMATVTPVVTELEGGWYNLALTPTMTDTLGDLTFHITAATADPCDFKLPVEAERTGVVADKSGFSLSVAGVQAIWDALTSGLATVGSVGKRIADNLDAAVTSRLSTAGYTAPPTAVQNADALLTRDMSSVVGEAARSPLNAFRFLRNLWTISPGGTLTVKKEDDATTAWTGTVSTTAGNPVSSIDPA